jgi:hypothetical protein
MLCCAVLCCAVLCCAVLCCAVLCCAVLCCAVLGAGIARGQQSCLLGACVWAAAGHADTASCACSLLGALRCLCTARPCCGALAPRTCRPQEHRQDPRRSRLKRIVPTIGSFFTPLKLVSRHDRGEGASGSPPKMHVRKYWPWQQVPRRWVPRPATRGALLVMPMTSCPCLLTPLTAPATPPPQVEAFREYDAFFHLSRRRYIPPNFAELRHILNIAQVRGPRCRAAAAGRTWLASSRGVRACLVSPFPVAASE